MLNEKGVARPLFLFHVNQLSIKDDGHQGGIVGQDTLRDVNLCCPIPNEVPVVIKYLSLKEKRGQKSPFFRAYQSSP